jgi:hypothetical protein
MFPQGVDTETALASIGVLPNADMEFWPCEVLLVVLSLLGIFAAAVVELLNQGWFVAAPCPDKQMDPVTKLKPQQSVQLSNGEGPPMVNSRIPKEGLAPVSGGRFVVKNTFIHFEEEDADDKPPSPLSRSMPIGAFNHTLKAELLQQTVQWPLQPRSPCRAAPMAVAPVIEEEPTSPQLPKVTAPVGKTKKPRMPRSARKKRPNLRPGTEWEPCMEPEVMPRTPIAGGGTPRSLTSSATPLCLEVLVPESGATPVKSPPRKVWPRIRHRLSLVKGLPVGPSFKAHEPRVIAPRIIEPVWGQFLD